MVLKSWNLQIAHLWHLTSIYTKFQFLNSIWRKMGKGSNHFFNVTEGETSHIPPPNWSGWLIFRHVIQLWIIYRLTKKKTFFGILPHQHPFLEFVHNQILILGQSHSKISNPPPSSPPPTQVIFPKFDRGIFLAARKKKRTKEIVGNFIEKGEKRKNLTNKRQNEGKIKNFHKKWVFYNKFWLVRFHIHNQTFMSNFKIDECKFSVGIRMVRKGKEGRKINCRKFHQKRKIWLMKGKMRKLKIFFMMNCDSCGSIINHFESSFNTITDFCTEKLKKLK